MSVVQFRVRVRNVLPDETVFVSGSNRTLGFWKPSRAKALERTGNDFWQTKVTFEKDENVYQMEYKYVVIQGRAEMETWLPGGNLKIRPPGIITATSDDWVLEEKREQRSNQRKPYEVQHTHNRHDHHHAPEKPDGNLLKMGESDTYGGVPCWYKDSIFYLIYCLGTPGHGGGGFFGDCPDVNDQTSGNANRLLKLRHWYDYLVDLGINAVYFTPIFDSGTHGYDTYDYFRIDRRLGDMNDFKTILAELHERNIRVVLDGVFNHTGRGHFAFSDILSRGREWRQSPYKDWYFLRDGKSSYGDKFDYEAWSGYQVLPKLNVYHPEVRNHIFDVARFWLELGIDGWRLDCAADISPEFWNDFRRVCRETRPGAVLIGEIIHGDYNSWVDDYHRLHSATNYQLYKPLWSCLKDRNFFELRHNIERDEHLYGEKVLMNFIGNHDVDRVLSILHDDRQLAMLATVLLFTMKGTPCLYYGDECFMGGQKQHGGDASLRQPMPYPGDHSWDRTLFEVTKHLTHLRKNFPAVRYGGITIVWNNETSIVYHRKMDDQAVAVVMNCGDSPATAEVGIENAHEYQWHPHIGVDGNGPWSRPMHVTVGPKSSRIFCGSTIKGN